jgi:hypothetical protein
MQLVELDEVREARHQCRNEQRQVSLWPVVGGRPKTVTILERFKAA